MEEKCQRIHLALPSKRQWSKAIRLNSSWKQPTLTSTAPCSSLFPLYLSSQRNLLRDGKCCPDSQTCLFTLSNMQPKVISIVLQPVEARTNTEDQAAGTTGHQHSPSCLQIMPLSSFIFKKNAFVISVNRSNGLRRRK